MSLPDDTRLLDLLAQEATEGLSPDERAELDSARGGETWDDLEYAAASLAVAWTSGATPLPSTLKQRVLNDYERPRQGFSLGWFGTLAAAAVLIGLIAYWQFGGVEPSKVAPHEALLATTGTIQASWTKPADPRFANVTGDVVWNDAEQRGYMRFRGMPRNDPTKQQYQLWIVDPKRDSKPVDGGVFDVIVEGGEVVIPFDARLPVDKPTVFAVTLEKPGGVVVSAGPLLVVAPTG